MVSWRGPREFNERDQRSSGDDRFEQWQQVCSGAVLRGAWPTAEVVISIGGQWPSDVRALQFFVASRMSSNTSEIRHAPRQPISIKASRISIAAIMIARRTRFEKASDLLVDQRIAFVRIFWRGSCQTDASWPSAE